MLEPARAGRAQYANRLRSWLRCAVTHQVNSTILAVNICVLIVIGLAMAWPHLRRRGEPEVDAEVPTSIRPSRDGRELTDAVTEWARATGILTPDRDRDDHEADVDPTG